MSPSTLDLALLRVIDTTVSVQFAETADAASPFARQRLHRIVQPRASALQVVRPEADSTFGSAGMSFVSCYLVTVR